MGDLLIRGALVADGTGAPAFPADVLVHEGRIAAVAPGLPGGRPASRHRPFGKRRNRKKHSSRCQEHLLLFF